MATVWYSNTDGQSYSNRGNDGHSFQQHNECMRRFRKCHDFLEGAERMRAFRLAHPKNWKQWGHNLSEVQRGLPALAPIREVVLTKYSQN